MNLSLLAVDGFHPAPMATATIAKTLSYETKEHDGHEYNGIGLGYNVESADQLLATILGAGGCKIDMEYFRLGTKKEAPTSYIHADSGISSHAAVWYLSQAPDGMVAGTAFWRHKELGLESVPSLEWIEKNFGKVEDFAKKIREDGEDESKWVMTGLIGQKYNRIAIYPTNLFHSRYPKEAWGNDVNDGRIVWTAFFRTF
jgi:hypothetical protein